MPNGKCNPCSQFVSVTNHKLFSYPTISATTVTIIATFMTTIQVYNHPPGIYLLKVYGRNTRRRCEKCSVLTVKTQDRRQWRCSCVFIVNFEHISHLVLVFLLLTLNM